MGSRSTLGAVIPLGQTSIGFRRRNRLPLHASHVVCRVARVPEKKGYRAMRKPRTSPMEHALRCHGMTDLRTREASDMTDFGDRVRIRESPETIDAGVAGLEGDVYGFTTPSVTGADVIGGSPDDTAVNVSIGAHGALWFLPDLLEFLHYNAGMEIVVGNIRSVRQVDGSWSQSDVGARPSSDSKIDHST
jgi:hypothetical protein